MFGLKLATLDQIGYWAMIIGACLGIFALAATSLSAYVLYYASNIAQDEANEKIRKIDLELAITKERAEQLRAKNLAMEKWIAPRELTPPQIAAIARIGETPEVHGKHIGVVAIYSDIESYRFATQFANILNNSGLTATPSASGGSLSTPYFGFGLTVQKGDENLGTLLVSAFSAAGIPINQEPIPGGFQDANATRIYIGLKPWYTP
ncbi:MAG: hypothetical protein AB3X44_08120 [Leptothrix sp. (in: b-proteobacteria)]